MGYMRTVPIPTGQVRYIASSGLSPREITELNNQLDQLYREGWRHQGTHIAGERLLVEVGRVDEVKMPC